MAVGDTFIVSETAQVKIGNRLPLAKIPVGTFIYNVALKPDSDARAARAAGNYAEVVAHDGAYVHVKMPSTEIRKILATAWASVGEVSNEEQRLVISVRQDAAAGWVSANSPWHCYEPGRPPTRRR